MTITKEGAIASFYTINKAPIKHLRVYFSPKQAGSGDSSPTNIRPITGWTDLNWCHTGVNLWDEVWEIGRINVNTGKNDNNISTTIRSKNYIPCKPGTEYYIRHPMGSNNLCLFYYDNHKNFISYVWKYSGIVTVPDNCYYLRFYLHSSYGTEYNNDVGINYPASKSSYVSCSGNTQSLITFPASGKNQFNPNAEWIIGSTYRYIPFYFGEYDYYMSFTVKDPNVDTSDLYIGFSYLEPIASADTTMGYNWCIEKGTIKQNHTNRISQGSTDIYYGLVGKYLLIYPNTADAYSRLISAYDIQIEKGTSPTSYEPCASDNVVYGGYVDFVRGKIVAEWREVLHSTWGEGTEASVRGDNVRKKFITQNLLIREANGSANGRFCNVAPWKWEYEQDILHYYCHPTNATGITTTYMFLPANTPDSTEIIVVDKLAIPIEYDIAPEQLKTLIGTNNIWSNADRVEVEYDLAESNDELYRRRNIILQGAPHLQKASGEIANFQTDMIAPIKDAKIYFNPIQEGTGDPSPTNIRVIKGWKEAHLYNDPAYAGFINWNQLILDGTFTNSSKWITNTSYGSLSLSNNVATWTCSTTPDYYYRTGITEINNHLEIPEDHKVLLYAEVRSSIAERIALYALVGVNEHSYPYYQNVNANEWTVVCGFCPQRASEKIIGKGKVCYGTSTQNIGHITVGTTLEAKNFMMFDLTQMFGAGNEPTAEQFKTMFNLSSYKVYNFGQKTSVSAVNGEDPTISSISFPAIKNLFDALQYGRKDGGKGFSVSEGSYSFDEINGGNSCIVWGTQTFPAGTYTLNAKVSGNGTIGFRLLCSSSSCGGTYNSYYNGYFINSSNNNSKITFTTTESFTIGICLLSNSQHEKEPGMAYDIQLERGSSASLYEPYGTAYGGYIDLTNNKLIATHGFYKTIFGPSVASSILGDTERHGYYLPVTFKPAIYLHGDGQGPYKLKRTFCNIAPWSWDYYSDRVHYYITDNLAYIMLPVGTDPNTEIELCAELATPIEYDLTSQQLKTLKGANNIWSNTNGPIEVMYWTH